jgi:hypothetical protein
LVGAILVNLTVVNANRRWHARNKPRPNDAVDTEQSSA